jgi:hypothetical protein
MKKYTFVMKICCNINKGNITNKVNINIGKIQKRLYTHLIFSDENYFGIHGKNPGTLS